MEFGEFTRPICAQIEKGAVVIFLGAGANGGSENRFGKPIATTTVLIDRMCQEMGEAHAGESLADVAQSFEHVLGRDSLNMLLSREFRHSRPSRSIEKLFKYSWKRIYTWNYDDSLEEASKKSVQRTQLYNGMVDDVEILPEPVNLQVVFLHGMITRLKDNVVLTEQDYAAVLQKAQHAWYRQSARDFRSSINIFVGTSLNEPILSAEIERAMRSGLGSSGLSYLITPDNITAIKRNSLRQRGVEHIKGTLEGFISWLESNIGKEYPPERIQSSQLFNETNIGRFSRDDLVAAQSLRSLSRAALINDWSNLDSVARSASGRSFLNGFPATWLLAASEVPVRLKQANDLKVEMAESIKAGAEIFLTVGQAGSGKSTASMQTVLDIAEDQGIQLFSLDPDVHSVSDALGILKRLDENRKIVFLPNLFVFGSRLEDDFALAREAKVTFVSTCRSSEWKDRYERTFSNRAVTFKFQKFEREDHEPLISRLRAYVPSPTFVKLSPARQIEKLAKSKDQLLIALREATSSKAFDDIIIDEYNSLANDDLRDLFVIAGISTLARVGVDPAAAAEAYYAKRRKTDFDDALALMEGIVQKGPSGRITARHEFYVRSIFAQAVSLDKLFALIIDMLSTFTKFRIPITKHVSKLDAALFRFLLNHGFLREWSERGGTETKGLDVFRRFEVDFQLDGHFWLQYGLYYQRLGEAKLAIEMLEKSVEAFPDNHFAVHALASERLFEAKRRPSFDPITKGLISAATIELERLDAKRHERFDAYPLVTLAKHHVPVLIKHGQEKAAISLAESYFERLKVLEKSVKSNEVNQAKGTLLLFLTTRIWDNAHQ